MEDLTKIFGGGSTKEVLYKQTSQYVPQWTDQTFRIILCGGSGSGKTTTVGNLLLHLMSYTEVILLTKAPEDKYERLQDIINGFVPDTMKTYYNVEELPAVDELPYDANAARIVIFDDFVKDSGNPKIVDYFLRGRKNNCGCIFLTQSFYTLDQVIREQASHIALYAGFSARKLGNIYNDYAYEIPKREFLRKYSTATSRNGGFLWIAINKTEGFKFRREILLPLD